MSPRCAGFVSRRGSVRLSLLGRLLVIRGSTMRFQFRNRSHAVAVSLALLAGPATARADVVLDWNAIAVRTLTTQPAPGVNPFAQARFMAITQLAVFEAVNAVEGGRESHLGTVALAPGASAEAAAIAAAHQVLVTYFSSAANLAVLDG